MLDLYPVRPQNEAVIASAEHPPAQSATRTILIVDDDRSVTDTFARILKLEGFTVATALSAEAGLELADNVLPDGIILDLRMPITSGRSPLCDCRRRLLQREDGRERRRQRLRFRRE